MSPRQHGIVLTYVDEVDQLEDCVRRGGYDTVKVITGWGLSHRWTHADVERVLNMVPNVIVRTVAGDPSAENPPPSRTPGPHTTPYPNQIEAEIAEWYSIRSNIMLNEALRAGVAPPRRTTSPACHLSAVV